MFFAELSVAAAVFERRVSAFLLAHISGDAMGALRLGLLGRT